MWLLNFLPDAVFHMMVAIGVLGIAASFVLGMVPFISKYKLPLQAISILLTVVGVWYSGGIAKDKEYREKLHQLELKVAAAEKDAAIANGRVEIVYRDKVKVVKDTQVVIQEKIKDVSVKIDSQCKITPESVDILNEAARRPGRVK